VELKAGWRTRQRWMAGVLCVEELSRATFNDQLGEDGPLEQVEELFEF
jgi:hypothetical protein